MPIYSQTVTNAGLNAFIATGTGAQLVITRVAVGSGSVANPATATALGSQKISAVTLAGNAVTTVGNEEISIIINNSAVSVGFNLTEYGVFGTSGGGPEKLLIYISDSAPIPIPPFSSGQINIYEYFGFAVSNTSNVTVTLATGAYALQSTFLSHEMDPGAHPQAFLNPINLGSGSQQGMVPQSPGDPRYQLAGGAVLSWIRGLQVIQQNVSLYVSTTGNDAAALAYLLANFPTVNNNSAHPFATIQAALNWLGSFFIPPAYVVTINVAAGVYSVSSPITINHPQGSQIQIIGAIGAQIPATYQSNSSQTIVVSGASGAFSGIMIGDWVLTAWATPADSTQGLYMGIWKVTGVSITTLTFIASTIPPTSLAGVTLTVQKLQTVLNFSAGISGVMVSGAGVGLFENFALIGTASGATPIFGFSVSGSCTCTIQACGATGWTNSGNGAVGFEASNGAIVTATGCYATQNSIGFEVNFTSSEIIGNQCYAVGNVWGFLSNQSTMNLVQCVSSANTYGFNPTSGGKMNLNDCQAQYNNYAALIQYSSNMICGGTIQCIFGHSSVDDIFLSVVSTFVRVSGPPTSYSTTNSTANVFNSNGDGCYFAP